MPIDHAGTDTIAIVEITGDDGLIREPSWLAAAEAVHRQLRTNLPADYSGTLQRVFAGGARMVVAVDGSTVAGVAVFRIHENTFAGRQLYVDDLVTDGARRSQGVGRVLMHWLESRARQQGCQVLALDSGVQRARAHRFYFREGFRIASYSFRKDLEDAP
jgi:GNAT superfamily N-acetyltransferase